MATPQRPSVKIDRPDSNSRTGLTVTTNENPPQGGPGAYRVTFILSIPGTATHLTDVDLEQFLNSGESLLQVPKEIVDAGATELNVEITYPNGRANVRVRWSSTGAMSTAEMRVEAANRLEAERFAYDLVMPLLSWWSYRLDVALDISGYLVLEERTGNTGWVLSLLGRARVLSDFGGMSKREYRVVLSAYREGLNSTNVFYQFLSFYRVIEGVRRFRARRKVQTLAAGREYRDPSDEQIPPSRDAIGITDPLVLLDFDAYLGRKFGFVLEQFRTVLRNAITHLDPTSEELVADKFDDVAVCERALPVVKYIARRMLRNELLADPEMAPHAPPI